MNQNKSKKSLRLKSTEWVQVPNRYSEEIVRYERVISGVSNDYKHSLSIKKDITVLFGWEVETKIAVPVALSDRDRQFIENIRRIYV